MLCITHLAYAAAKHLDGLVPVAAHRSLPCSSHYIPWHYLPVLPGDLCRMEVEEAVDRGERIFTTKITANLSTEIIFPDDEPLAFLAVADNGDRFVVGLDERPFPVATARRTHSDNPTESTRLTVQVTWTARFPPLLCV